MRLSFVMSLGVFLCGSVFSASAEAPMTAVSTTKIFLDTRTEIVSESTVDSRIDTRTLRGFVILVK